LRGSSLERAYQSLRSSRRLRELRLNAIDDAGAVEAHEGVHPALEAECGDEGIVGILALDVCQKCLGLRVVGFAVERELKVVRDVVVARIYPGLVRQLRDLVAEGRVQDVGVAGVAMADPGVENRVAAQEVRFVGMSQQRDVDRRVAGRFDDLEIDRLANPDMIALACAHVDTRDAVARIVRADQLRPGRRDRLIVARDMVGMFMGVEDPRDVPTPFLRHREGLGWLDGIDRHGLARLGAGDHIEEVAPGVSGPDLFDDHDFIP
jgi:hypothetical protein